MHEYLISIELIYYISIVNDRTTIYLFVEYDRYDTLPRCVYEDTHAMELVYSTYSSLRTWKTLIVIALYRKDTANKRLAYQI